MSEFPCKFAQSHRSENIDIVNVCRRDAAVKTSKGAVKVSLAIVSFHHMNDTSIERLNMSCEVRFEKFKLDVGEKIGGYSMTGEIIKQ